MDQAQADLPADALRLRDAVARRLHDVYHVQIPRLAESKDLSDYEAELHETLQRIASLVQQMADDMDDAESAAERAALKTMVDTQRNELTRVRQASRRALLAAHRAAVSRQQASARSALLGNAVRQNNGVRAAPMDRASATSEQVTGALQRTVKLMSSELEKSGYSTQLLAESSETIAQVSNKYASFNDLLRDSVSMIRQMERAELVDLGILVASITFFLACVLYILYVRIFSRGIHALSLTWHASSSMGSSVLGLFSTLKHREARHVSREHDPIEEAIRYASMEEAVPRRHRKPVQRPASKPSVEVVELTASPTPESRSEVPSSLRSKNTVSPLTATLTDLAHTNEFLTKKSTTSLVPTGDVLPALTSAVYESASTEEVLSDSSSATFLAPTENVLSASTSAVSELVPADEILTEKSMTSTVPADEVLSDTKTATFSIPVYDFHSEKSTTSSAPPKEILPVSTSTVPESVSTDLGASEPIPTGQKNTSTDSTSTINEPTPSETSATMATTMASDLSSNSAYSSSSESTLLFEPTSSNVPETSSLVRPRSDVRSSSERRRRPWDEL